MTINKIKSDAVLDKEYVKHNSFINLNISNSNEEQELISKKIKHSLESEKKEKKLSPYKNQVLDKVFYDLFTEEKKTNETFKLTPNVIAEIQTLDNEQIPKYLFHRYRYEIYPKLNKVDEYPPYLQIEPSSICNYRCVFCFETDKSFTSKKGGYMGTSTLDLYKKIVDEAEGNIEFISLASRGEPLVSKEIIPMLKYSERKFLNLKMNTNASLLTEKISHAILSDTIKTLVFSADAADPELYKKLRVNGSLEKILKNIEIFNKIKEKHYPKSKIITRVSGVKVNEQQSFDSMKKLWSGLVDQVAFVDYNPWESVYSTPKNDIVKPCSDLWRRMFVWWDGKVNPCDTDYKSVLSSETFPKTSLKEIWTGSNYKKLRETHLVGNRQKVFPCKSCTLI
jgi:wyosine [tRNA(Phe)-imidazoG37] synthetase (radical SAM superfamily)